MPRKEHKYHYLYKITNLKNDKYYIGMHSTDNLDDGYFGSGKKIRNSVRKHGKCMHKIEFLEFFENRKDLALREAEIVNAEFLKDYLCMNLQLGGGGGFISEEHRLKCQRAGGKKVLISFSKKNAERLKNDLEYKIRFSNSLKGHKSFLDKKHTKESIEKMRKSKIDHGIGKNNSQFGTKWINNRIIDKKIKETDLDSYINNGWYLGRIKKNKI